MKKYVFLDYQYQFLSDVIESLVSFCSLDDELLKRFRDLQNYILSIRHQNSVNVDTLEYKDCFYVEVYED